eukprot:71495_1
MSKKGNIKEISYDIQLNDKVKLDGNISATVKYIGPIFGKPEYETYYGIVFKNPIGDTNGRIKKKIYFKCKAKYGTFVQRKAIVYPFPIIFNELCDTTFHILASTIFSYFDPVSIGNFGQIHNGLCQIIFNVQNNCNLTWKKQWRLFISPKSEDTNFSKRWQRLYDFYISSIYEGCYRHKQIAFGLWKITNVKDDELITNAQKAMAVLRALLPVISQVEYSEEDKHKYLSTKPDRGSLKFDSLVRKIKIKNAYLKAIKTEQDATIKMNVGAHVCGSIYYQHIQTFKDIFKNNVNKSKPFCRKYLDRKPLKELRNALNAFLMPSFMELVVKQWFVVNVDKKGTYEDAKPHSYIIGWISAKRLIVVGGCYGRYKDEAHQSQLGFHIGNYSDDFYWSNSS